MPGNALKFLHSLPRSIKFYMMLVLDALALIAAAIISLFLTGSNAGWVSILAIPAGLILFYFLGVYKAVVSHIGTQSFLRIVLAVLLNALVFGVLVQNVAFALLFGLCAFVFAAGWRYGRMIIASGESGPMRKRIAIYGAGEAGMQAAASMQRSREYRPVCFLDDNPDLQGRVSMDLPIHTPEHLDKIIKADQLDAIVLAIPSATRSARNVILTKLEPYDIPIRTLPGMADILADHAKVGQVQDIDPLDLHGRDPVPPQIELLRHCVAGKNVMVTGAGGSIGSELCRQIIAQDPDCLVLFEVSEYALYQIERELKAKSSCKIIPVLGTVQDKDHLFRAMQAYRIQTVYHAAAYKHVPLVEQNIAEAVLNNTFGTLNAAEAAAEAKAKSFVLISTDKAVRPTSAMGATKRMAEKALQMMSRRKDVKTCFSFVRFGNVLDSSGSVIPLFRRQIAEGGPVTVTHRDMERYFMSIPEAAQLVLQAGAMAKPGDGFALEMGEPVKIYDMAKKMVRLSGYQPKTEEHPDGDIEITITGLRPGEKLYEELFIDEKKGGQKTDHSQIWRAQEQDGNAQNMEKDLISLQELVARGDEQTLREGLFSMIEQ